MIRDKIVHVTKKSAPLARSHPLCQIISKTPMRTLVLALCAAVAQAQRGYDPASQRYQEEVRCASSPRPITAPRF